MVYTLLLAQKLNPLRGLVAGTEFYFDVYGSLYNAQEKLRYFLVNPLMPPLTSYSTGNALFNILLKLTTEDYVEDREVKWGEPGEIVEALNRFEISLQPDFGTRDTFILSAKGTHSTTQLSEYGQNMVSTSVRELVPDIDKDLHDAGRCIAFELPTAGHFICFGQ